MDQAHTLLRHYRLNVVEGWIGYGVATIGLLLWPGRDQAPALADFAVYIALFVGASLGALMLIERRRPWPFGQRHAGERQPRSLANLAWFFITFVTASVVSDLVGQSEPAVQISVYGGVCLVSFTASVLWAPLLVRLYPWSRALRA